MMINTSLKRQHKGKSAIQIASSGPAFDLHQIEYGYTKMIMSAKIYIYAKPLLYSRSIVYQSQNGSECWR